MGAFGLDRPQLSVALHADSGPVLRAQFGGRNPDNMAQYMTVEGRDGVVVQEIPIKTVALTVEQK
jgi:hypothetical protein